MIHKIKNIVRDKDLNEILSKGFSFLLVRATGLFAGYFFTFLIAYQYGSSVNGLIALSFTLLLCVGVFGRLGFDINIVRHYSLNHLNFEKGFFYRLLLLSFLFSCLLAVILFLLKDFFVYEIFNKPQLEPYIFWIAISIPFWSIVLICGGFYRGKKDNVWFAFLDNPGRFILSLFFFIVLLFFTNDSLIPIKAHFFGVITLAIIALLKTFKSLQGISFKSKKSVFMFFKDSLPMMVSGTTLIFLGWSDTFVLGVYESDKVVGVYNVAIKIAALTSFSLHAINSILAPKIASSYEAGDQKYKRLILFSTRVNFFITLGIVISIVCFRKFILGFFGQEFLSGQTTLFVLCIGQLINSLSGSVGIILQMIGHQKKYQTIVLVALVLNIILNFILTPIYGSLGAAIATVISMSFWNISGALYLKKKLNIISYFRIVR